MPGTMRALPRGTLAPTSCRQQRRRNQRIWWLVYLTVLAAGLVIGALAYKRLYQPYLGLAWGCFALLLAAWVKFPRAALGATLALTLTGDLVTVYWFPFAKNLSSVESIMYIAGMTDAISFSPLEITLIWALAVTLYRNVASMGRPLHPAPLLVPFAVFGGFALLGLARGLSRGGDTRAAIYEIRPLILLPLLYVLVVNVCRNREDYRRMFWIALLAIVVQSLLSLHYLAGLTAIQRDSLESLNQHGSAIGINLLFMVAVTALAFRRVSPRLRILLVLASVPAMWVYLVAQRRAAIVALGIAFAIFAVMLFWRQRRTFWKLIPVVTVMIIGYTGAFWNSESSAAFPAQAVKSVIAPDQAGLEDQYSDIYRTLEGFNLAATVRAAPVLGIGFGQPFLRPYPLPDISVFEFEAYIPHNSFIWIWTKMGFGGFVSLIYIVGRSMMQGASRARAAPVGADAVVALNAVLFVAMYTVFLYVDIAWEARNVFLLALSLGLCTGPLDQSGPTPAASTTPRPRPVEAVV